MNKFYNFPILFLIIAATCVSSIHSRTRVIASVPIETKPEQSEELRIYRLTDEVEPTSYKLEIIPDLIKFTFSGKVEIIIAVRFATNQIKLHSQDLTIKNCELKRAGQSIDKEYKLDKTNDLLTIETTQSLKIETKYSLVIEFEGVLSDDMTGFYKSSYTINNDQYWLAITQFEPTNARRAFPCFDEPRFKTPFIISVAHFAHQTATSNMPIDVILPADSTSGNRQWTKFKETPPMPTYLVSFMVSEFTSVPNAEEKIHVWTRKNAMQRISYTLKQSTKLLNYLEGYFGISYKLPKLDVIAVPDFNMGAMENWGMTTYKERYILVDEETSNQNQKLEGTQIICHEFSHQWFGDLTTPAWWDFLWLKESFAQYFQYFAVAAIEPTWNIDQLFVVEIVQWALWVEVGTQRAMTSSVKTKEEINQLYDVISYAKGASVLRMLEHVLSPTTFKSALHRYLKSGYEEHGGTVIPAYFYQALDEQAYRYSPPLPPQISASQVLRSWTENIGFPLITVTRMYDTGLEKIEQSSYQSIRAPEPAPHQEWIVPLTYTTKSTVQFTNTQPSLWSFGNKVIHIGEVDIISPTDWILFNIQHAGYYRVQYDDKNWELLIDQLHQDLNVIHVLNRAQLLDDSLALASDKQLDYRIALRLVQYLSNEYEILPWDSALGYLNSMFSLIEGWPFQGTFQKFLHSIMEKPFHKFGFEIKTTDEYLTKIRKSSFLSLACKIELNGCVSRALEEYEKNKNDLSKIQPELKEVVYCAALKHSSSPLKEFDNIWNQYLKSDIAFDREIILKSFRCSSNQEVHEKLIKMLADFKNKDIRRQDRDFIFNIYSSDVGAADVGLKIIFNIISKETELSQYDSFALETFEYLIYSIGRKINQFSHQNMIDQMQNILLKMNMEKYKNLAKAANKVYRKIHSFVYDLKIENISFLHAAEYLLKQDSNMATPQTPSSASSARTSLWTRMITAAIISLLFHVIYLKIENCIILKCEEQSELLQHRVQYLLNQDSNTLESPTPISASSL